MLYLIIDNLHMIDFTHWLRKKKLDQLNCSTNPVYTPYLDLMKNNTLKVAEYTLPHVFMIKR